MPAAMPLFTLVRIAGEDDLDAPDIIAPAGQAATSSGSLEQGEIGRSGNGLAAAGVMARRPSKFERVVSKPILEPDNSLNCSVINC